MTQTNDTPMREASRDDSGAAWCAANRFIHVGHVIAHAPFNSAPSACVINPACPTCCGSARSSSVAERSWRGLSTSAPAAVNASSASAAAQTAVSLLAPSAWAVTARNAIHPCCWSICSERRWWQLPESSTAAANGRGHAALLAQSLDNRCAVTHMTTPELRRRAALAVSRIQLIPQNKSHGWPNSRGDRLD
jgi:hypothetical protein